METTKKTKEMDMLNGGLAGKLILFSIPLAFSSILQQLFNSADVAVVGRFAGDRALAAVGSCVALVGIFVNLIVGFSVLSVVLLIAVIVCIVKMNKLYRRYDLFMRGKDAETLEDTLEDILEELKESQSRDRASKDAMKRLSKQVKDSFQKFGFVKYNAFKGMGGNLSFVIAMLDGNNTGFVLDVVHSREGCYIYLKEVEEGATEVLLGSEEQEALEQALGYAKRPSISDGDGKRGRREKTEDVYSGSGEQSIEISGSERNKSERMKKLRRQQREAIGADMDEIMDMEDMDGVEPERNEGEY